MTTATATRWKPEDRIDAAHTTMRLYAATILNVDHTTGALIVHPDGLSGNFTIPIYPNEGWNITALPIFDVVKLVTDRDGSETGEDTEWFFYDEDEANDKARDLNQDDPFGPPSPGHIEFIVVEREPEWPGVER